MFGMAAMMGFAMTFTACSNDDDAVVNNHTQKREAQLAELTFNALGSNGKVGTRATPTTTDNFWQTITDFKVWGYYADGVSGYYLGTQGADGIVIVGADDNSSSGQTWNYQNENDVRYWPTTALNFYAVTPATNDNYSYSSANLTYSVPTDNSEQKDVMVARVSSLLLSGTENSSGVVNLPFEHKLSQVAFSAKAKTSGMTIEIGSIEIHNVQSQAVINLEGADLSGTDVSASGDRKTYAVTIAENNSITSTTNATNITTDDGVLIVAPQTTDAWADGTSTSAADDAKQSYLKISCRIRLSDGSYLIGSADTYGETYVSFPTTWESGKKYVYTLIFGVGKDANGSTNGTPITFTVTSSNWTDATGSDVAL